MEQRELFLAVRAAHTRVSRNCIWLIVCMPTRRVEDLVSKIVASGVSRAKAERIVSGLNNTEIATALKSAKALKAIIDGPT